MHYRMPGGAVLCGETGAATRDGRSVDCLDCLRRLCHSRPLCPAPRFCIRQRFAPCEGDLELTGGDDDAPSCRARRVPALPGAPGHDKGAVTAAS